MNNMTFAPTAAPKPADVHVQSLQAIGKMLDLLTDPVATKAAVKSLSDSAVQSNALLETVRAESAAVAKRKDHVAAVTEERAALDVELKTKRAAFETECAERSKKRTGAETAARSAQAAAQAERERNSALNTDLQRRLGLIYGAATAPSPLSESNRGH